MGLRDAARRRLEARLRARCATPSAAELARSAVVFAPHPDDETLACGGTIAAKRRAGAEVHVVFMTDGAASHAAFMPHAEAREMRALEALAACEQLGVERDAVTFLEFADGTLPRHLAVATARAARIIEELRPLEVYVPCHGDGHADHEATRASVSAALLHTRPYRPQTNGKAERFIQTLLNEWAYARPYRSNAERLHQLPRWLYRYNARRARGGIGGVAPALRL